jgi:hypothetical protein
MRVDVGRKQVARSFLFVGNSKFEALCFSMESDRPFDREMEFHS